MAATVRTVRAGDGAALARIWLENARYDVERFRYLAPDVETRAHVEALGTADAFHGNGAWATAAAGSPSYNGSEPVHRKPPRRAERTCMASADSLTARIDALADALRNAGVPQERTARILGAAAEATMHALVLDAVLDEQLAPRAPLPAGQQTEPVEQPVRLAA